MRLRKRRFFCGKVEKGKQMEERKEEKGKKKTIDATIIAQENRLMYFSYPKRWS